MLALRDNISIHVSCCLKINIVFHLKRAAVGAFVYLIESFNKVGTGLGGTASL